MAAIVLALAAVACTSTTQPTPAQQQNAQASSGNSSNDTKPKTSTTVATDSSGKPTATKRKKGAKPYSEQLDASIKDIQDFWAKTMPDVYQQKYERIPDTKIMAATSKKPAPGCGSGQPDYEAIRDNAFYCPRGQYVAFDDEHLFPDLYTNFGEFTISVVLAHEWGHAIQDQIGVIDKLPTIVAEQQADCFAGVWTAHVMSGDSSLKNTPADLQGALAGMVKFKDPVGTDPSDDQAHGSGFDRVNAFQEGFEQGAPRCAEYVDASKRPKIVEIPFTSTDCPTTGGSNVRASNASPSASCGDLSYDDAVSAITVDLNEYWQATGKKYNFDFKPVDKRVRYGPDTSMPTCAKKQLTEDDALNHIFFCVEDNFVAWDDNWLEYSVNDKPDGSDPNRDGIGDFATGALLAKQWAVSFQAQEGLTKAQINSKSGELQQSCFTGAWAGDVNNGGGETRTQKLRLQPGDLDEALIAFLAFSDEPDDKGNSTRGTGFEHAEAFRDGFFNGPLQCDTYSSK